MLKRNTAGNLREKAYNVIKKKIISNELTPGMPISEKTLMLEIGASRTPLREAFSKLENEKLVKIFPKRGIFVTEVTVKDVIDLYNVREVIEPLAARLATPDINLKELEFYYEYFSRPGSHDMEERLEVDQKFHALIANSVGNQYLSQILMNIYDQNSRIRVLSKLKFIERQEEARQEHFELINCFMERDVEKVEMVMRQHIHNGRKTAMKVVSG